MPNTNQEEINVDNKDSETKGLTHIKNINKYIIIIIIILTILIASIISFMIYKTVNNKQKSHTRDNFIKKDIVSEDYNILSADIIKIIKDSECLKKNIPTIITQNDAILTFDYKACRKIVNISFKGTTIKVTEIKY